ncbi:MAG: tyrosine-type recombinase/integrase [Streptosporangiaceae bacterium]
MDSENAVLGGSQDPDPGSENTDAPAMRRRGRPAATVPAPFATVLGDYTGKLATAPVAAQTRRTYASKVRQFLIWLAGAECDGDPLADAPARDWAVRDYRTHLQAVLKRAPRTVNNAMAAVDDFYLRLGLGPASARRAELPKTAPRALLTRAAVKYLREVGHQPSPRDKAIALLPFYAGTRISEVAGPDVDDVRLSARKGVLRVYGKGSKIREIPVCPPLRAALTQWLGERPGWPGAGGPALFLNQQGGRLSATSASNIITGIAAAAAIGDDATSHVLRHTFATTLVRAGTDLVTVAELLGHSRVENVQIYSQPTEDDKIKALDHLITDE